MEKLTIVLPSTLTVPAIKGGAVEQLLEDFLCRNEERPQFECDVVAHYIKGVEVYGKDYKYTKFHYVKMPTLFIRMNSILINRFKLGWLPMFYDHLLIKRAIAIGNKKILLEGNARLAQRLNQRFPQAKIYSHIHADLILAKTQKELDFINSTEKIICVSEYIGKEQIKRKINPEKVVSVLNGIKTDRFDLDKIIADKKAIRKSFSLPEEGKMILFKGRLVREKGIVELLEAFSKIERKDIILVLAGSKNFGEKRYKKSQYEKKIEKYVKEDKRIIMLGHVDYSKLPLLHKIADIAVVPSIWQEPCGLVVIEAVVSGVPLIASKTGGTPEVIGEAKSILIDVNENYIDSLKEAMEKLLFDDKLCEEIRMSQLERTKNLTNERYFNELCGALGEK